MDKELFLIAYGIADQHLHSDGEATYALYEALEKAYALGVKDHTDDARRNAFNEGYQAGVEDGAFHAYLDVEVNGRSGAAVGKPNAQVEGAVPEVRKIEAPEMCWHTSPDFVVDSKGEAMTPFQRVIRDTPPDHTFDYEIVAGPATISEAELHRAVAALG